MKFSKFSKQNIKSSNNKESTGQEEIKSNFEKFSSMSSNQLLNELFSTVAQQKQQGTFDYNSLLNTLNSMQSYMSKEEYEKVKDLLNQIR